MRVLRWGTSDVYDYRVFPERPIANADAAFRFRDQTGNNDIELTFEAQPQIDHLDQFIRDTSTQALLVVEDDALLYEGYGPGFQRDSIVTSFSATKSFGSILIGVAIDQGYIDSVNDPITKYIPELAERDARFEQILIRDLLKMSSGIKYEEFPFVNGDDALTYYYPDLRQLAITKTEIIGEPGESFLYNNYHPLLYGIILERATSQPVAEFLEENIW